MTLFETLQKATSEEDIRSRRPTRAWATWRAPSGAVGLFIAIRKTIPHHRCLIGTRRRTNNGPNFRVRFRFVDDQGCVISNVLVRGWMRSLMDKEGGAAYSCISDANGEAIATGRCDDSFTACFSKEGYYSGKDEYVLEQLREIQSVKGEMTDLTLQDITLRQVRNPIDLSVSRYETITIPQYDMWIGFDMERRSWVKPYGCGEHADVLLRFRKTVVHPLNDFEAHMDVSFTNNVHAGFYVKKKNRDSCLLTDYCAETNMPFKTTLACAHAKHLKQRVWTGISEDDYLVFRTRTKVDERGRLVSANYGKIVGRWGFYGAMRAEAIVFNPTPNDTNLEDADTVRRMMKQREK